MPAKQHFCTESAQWDNDSATRSAATLLASLFWRAVVLGMIHTGEAFGFVLQDVKQSTKLHAHRLKRLHVA